MGTYGVIAPPLRPKTRTPCGKPCATATSTWSSATIRRVLRKDKEKGREDMWKTPPGMTGLQTLLLSMLALVDEGQALAERSGADVLRESG